MESHQKAGMILLKVSLRNNYSKIKDQLFKIIYGINYDKWSRDQAKAFGLLRHFLFMKII